MRSRVAIQEAGARTSICPHAALKYCDLTGARSLPGRSKVVIVIYAIPAKAPGCQHDRAITRRIARGGPYSVWTAARIPRTVAMIALRPMAGPFEARPHRWRVSG